MTPDPLPIACAEFDRQIEAVLDRLAEPASLATSHVAGCENCRQKAAEVTAFLAGLNATKPLAPPADFADRVLAAAMWDRRSRLRRRRATVSLAVAASIALAVIVVRPWFVTTTPTGVATQPKTSGTPVRIGDTLSEAGSALAALTLRTADEAAGPTRVLLPAVEPSVPLATLPPVVEPAVESLVEMPRAAQSGLEPVANTTRRAVNLFLRDTGLGG